MQSLTILLVHIAHRNLDVRMCVHLRAHARTHTHTHFSFEKNVLQKSEQFIKRSFSGIRKYAPILKSRAMILAFPRDRYLTHYAVS